MRPDELVQRLKEALPTQLRSVVLYGSTAAGDHAQGTSDFNVLIIAEPLGMAELRVMAKSARSWERHGNRAPLLFTPGEFRRSADAFPIEMMDMQQWHRVLYGEDPFTGIKPDRAHLALELERELKGRLLALREHGLTAADQPSQLVAIVVESLSTFLVLFRAALRLYQPDVPASKLEAMQQLAGYVHFDPQVFLTVQRIREGASRPRGVSGQELFAAYLSRVEQITDAVDRRLHAG